MRGTVLLLLALLAYGCSAPAADAAVDAGADRIAPEAGSERFVACFGQSNAALPVGRTQLRHRDLVTDLRLDGSLFIGPEFSNHGEPDDPVFARMDGEYVSLCRLVSDDAADDGAPVTFLSAALGNAPSWAFLPGTAMHTRDAELMGSRHVSLMVIDQGEENTRTPEAAHRWRPDWNAALDAWPRPDLLVVVMLAEGGPGAYRPEVRAAELELCAARGAQCIEPVMADPKDLHRTLADQIATAARIVEAWNG